VQLALADLRSTGHAEVKWAFSRSDSD